MSGARCLCRRWRRYLGKSECDFLDVLSGGGEQALGLNGGKTAEPGVAMAKELLGVGKGALDGLLASFIETRVSGVR